jgi:hypothetical protein
MIPVLVVTAAIVAAAIAALAPERSPRVVPDELPAVLSESFDDRPDGLVTNSWAHFNPDAADAVVDADWRVTGGSLFASRGRGWTGPVDGRAPDARSEERTGSASFRMRSRRADFGSVLLSASVRLEDFVVTGRTPRHTWDGAHLFLRYQSPQQLYVASVARQDGSLVIKKKCPGGPSHGGTYHTLGSKHGRPPPMEQWIEVAADVRDVPEGVRLRAIVDGKVVVDAVDTGEGCAPIRSAGRVGLRGDNVELYVDDIVVRSYDRAADG